MTLQMTATRLSGDTYRFDVSGFDAGATTWTINYGDGTAPVTLPVATPNAAHTYTVVGHHTYTVTVTAGRTPYAATLQELSTKDPLDRPVESLFAAVATITGSGTGTFELSQRFTPNVDGYITAVKLLRHAGAPASHKFNIWRVSDGTRLATVTSAGETGAGWITVPLATPLLVKAGVQIGVSYGVAGQQFSYVQPVPTPAAPSLTLGLAANTGTPDTPPNSTAPGVWYCGDAVFDPTPILSDLAGVTSLKSLADITSTSETATVAVVVDVGPATIWAKVIPGDPVPAIQVDTFLNTGPAVLRWQVYRDAPGESVPVWIGTDVQTAISFVDYTAPLATAVTYRLVVTYTDYTQATATSNTVSITGTAGCFLTDPVTGETVALTLVSWPERERQARRSVLDVLGRADPVVLSDVHSTPAGVWLFYTATDGETAALLNVLLYAAVVVLRTQPDSSIASVTASVGDVNERRFSSRGGDQRRYVVCNQQEIAPLPATALPLRADLAGLATLADTLGDLSLVRPTLLQLSQIPTNVGARDAANV